MMSPPQGLRAHRKNVKLYDEGKFEDVSLADDVEREQGEVGAATTTPNAVAHVPVV